MRISWFSYLVVPFILAIVLVLVTRPADQAATISPANLSLGPGHAAAAGPAATPVATSAVPGKGPAADKQDDTPPVAVSDGTFDLRHAPSVDTATIARILQRYGSPAVGAAETIYTLGLQYGVDPAFCLAFFIHESSAGTQGVARTTKSVGNIRATPGYRSFQGFRQYDSWEAGIDDWYQLIRDLYIGQWGLTTVDQIVPVYAPSSDNNDPSAYAATIKRLVAGWRRGEG